MIVVILNIKQKVMQNNIIKFIDTLKQKNIISGKDMEFVFSKILEYSKNNNDYYNFSKDYELLDCSLEYYGKANKLEDVFRFSYFGTNLNFIKEIFLYFGYDDNLYFFIKKYKLYFNILKDKFITCGFKFKNNKLIELKIYFDLIKKEELFILEQLNNKLEGIKVNILLKSFTFNKDGLIEEKLYIPPDNQSLEYSKNKLKNNKIFLEFLNYNLDYYDILYRYKNNDLSSVKFYYNIRENKFLKDLVKNKFGNILLKQDFFGLNVKDELGVDFNLNNGINKYNYYIGLYK